MKYVVQSHENCNECFNSPQDFEAKDMNLLPMRLDNACFEVVQ